MQWGISCPIARGVQTFHFKEFEAPGDTASLRAEVRQFIASHRPPQSDPALRANCWAVGDKAFSQALGRAGYIGMIWPKAYGGHARHPLERYIVLEELLAAGAPVGMHWIADRQTGALLLRYGTEEQRRRFLPSMAAGELYTCIGMSEPNSGSDLASVSTRAMRVDGGWRVTGQKTWTTNAHNAQIMIALVRSDAASERQQGLSQVIIELDQPGVTVRPIIDLTGGHDFNEVFLDDVFVPDERLVGQPGDGWHQVTAELSLERSGPERYLSSYALLVELIRHAQANPTEPLLQLIGEITARLFTVRQMSRSTAAKLAAGEDPALEAAVVKDLGNSLEQWMPRAAQTVLDIDLDGQDALSRILSVLLLVSPSFSLRGGTREILRGIVARGLGLR